MSKLFVLVIFRNRVDLQITSDDLGALLWFPCMFITQSVVEI